jgi:HEAT repeat protein
LKQLQKKRGGKRLRRAVNSSLALLGNREAVAKIIHELPTQQGSIRREIIELLKQVASKSISSDVLSGLLMGLLSKDQWETRRAAAEALGELGLDSAEPRLRRLMLSATEHFMVRYSSAEALGHLGRAASRDALLNALILDRSLLVRSAAAEALGIVGGDNSLDHLQLALMHDSEWRVRRAAAESCGLLQSAEALVGLKAAIHDPHFRVRLAVTWALAEIADPQTDEILAEIAKDDLSLHVRRAANNALERSSRN